MVNIQARLHDHYDEALKHFKKEQILGVFYYGSANYGTNNEDSDVDTKVIIIPTWEQLAFHYPPVSTTFQMPNSEEFLDCKDIREYFKQFRKQSINFLEILFTEYKIINLDYILLWKEIVDAREEIARYSERAAFNTIIGMAMRQMNEYKKLQFPTDEEGQLTRMPYHESKCLYNILRLEEFLDRYAAGVSYAECLKTQKADYLKAVKNEEYYDFETGEKIGDNAIRKMLELEEDYIFFTNLKEKKIENLLNSVAERIIRQSVEMEWRK